MLKKFSPIIILLCIVQTTFAQMWGGGGMGGGMKGAKAKVGHFYGKVVDSLTGKSVPFAPVQLSGQQWDSVSKAMKTVVIQGLLTGDNGEFSFEKLAVMGTYTIEINAMGYKPKSVVTFFDMSKLMKAGQKMQSQSSGDMPNMSNVESLLNAIDKDLGNIKVSSIANQLKDVTVNGSSPPMELKLDKRVFDVSKSLTTEGGTAEDVLKTIPSVNVDIDGNVKMRNASPTIYVDGMPTTLTIDQIPAGQIDKIEVITNPSAKYDASAGTGGIINIILKHKNTLGYNGSLRLGADEYGKVNGGFDFNVRQGKINVFLDLHVHQIKHKMYGSEYKDTVANQSSTSPKIIDYQNDTNTMEGYFAFARLGFDYFIDNRNTLTVSGMLVRGDFNSTDLLHTNNVYTDTLSLPKFINENSASSRVFTSPGVSLLYKHLFPKEDENITASVTANQGSSSGTGNFDFLNYDFNNVLLSSINQMQQSGGTNKYYVGKLDYTDPLSKKIKLEAGVQYTYSQVNSYSNFYLNDIFFNDESNTYLFNQYVYAGYFTFSEDLNSRLSYQIALRMEQSVYNGTETSGSTSTPLNNQNLLKPFPGAFVTYHLTEKSDLQFSYTTHITRPSFAQLVVKNNSNPENIQVPNPNLKPAYQNSFEFNYMNTFNKRNSLLLSAYYKITYDIISTQTISSQYDPILKLQIDSTTYANANYGYQEGAEATLQNSIGNWLDITTNFNLFESGVNATNLNIPDTAKKFLSYFAKLNLTFKLPKNFTIQLNGSYLSKSKISPESGGGGGGRWGGGGGYGGGISPSTSGYIDPNYSLDVAIKKEFFKNKASVTLNCRDIFATAKNGSEVVATSLEGAPLYFQTTSRTRDVRFFSINLSYRFGQMDVSIFKHKNNNIDAGPDMGGGGDSGN